MSLECGYANTDAFVRFRNDTMELVCLAGKCTAIAGASSVEYRARRRSRLDGFERLLEIRLQIERILQAY